MATALITPAKSEVFFVTVPGKTRSCLACGKPILVSADDKIQQIIKDAKAGFVSYAEDVIGFVQSIKFVLNTDQTKKRIVWEKRTIVFTNPL